MTKLTLLCVGMRHRITPKTMMEVSEACPLKVRIEREPENHADKNALAVVCLEEPWKEMKFGYVSRAVAQELSRRIDRGRLQITESWLTDCDSETGTGEMSVTTVKSGSTKGKIPS